MFCQRYLARRLTIAFSPAITSSSRSDSTIGQIQERLTARQVIMGLELRDSRHNPILPAA